MFEEASVTQLRPLLEGDLGFISTEKGAILGRGEFLHDSVNSLVRGPLSVVITIFAKTGGRNGNYQLLASLQVS